ncbi:MAG: hypothetical protein OEZ22_07850 [Spirochaetia bacterium]|nr:hypothetical protein [Spirochaetia bacterium]
MLILALGFFNCQTPQKKQKKNSQINSTLSFFIDADIDIETVELSIYEINKKRHYPLEYKSDTSAFFIFKLKKTGKGFLIQFYQGQKLIQTARSLSRGELPIALAAITGDHIPDTNQIMPLNFNLSDF